MGINSTEIIDDLLRSGADVEATDVFAYTPLLRAMERGKKEAAWLEIIRAGHDARRK